VVNAFLNTVTETLKSGDKVAFTGSGSFEANVRETMETPNPVSIETIQIKAIKTPKFKAGKGPKDAVAKFPAH
jgi:DNA-binding protein HU-beta